MITSFLLSIFGIIVGLYYRAVQLLVVTCLVILVSVSVWLVRREMELLKLLVLFAYLTALQAGYLVGIYVRYSKDGDLS